MKYSPQIIHRFYEWLDKLPMATWVFYPLLLIILGLLNHPLSWSEGIIEQGNFDLVTLLTFSWLVESLALGHFIVRSSGKVLDGFRSQLPLNSKSYSELRFSFTTIPSRAGTIYFFIGAIIGYLTANSIWGEFSGLSLLFLSIVYIQWAISLGIGFMFVFFTLRQIRQIKIIFSMPEEIQLRNLSAIYGFSRYMAIISFGYFIIGNVNALFLSPKNFQNPASAAQSYLFIVFCLTIFYYPLKGINERISQEKEKLLGGVNFRIERMFDRIHAADDSENYENSEGMQNLLTALSREREIISSIPTWPWKPRTFTTLLSALTLPIIIGIAQSLIERFLNL